MVVSELKNYYMMTIILQIMKMQIFVNACPSRSVVGQWTDGDSVGG